MLAGYTVGGGVEYAITPNWSVKGEALYANLGTTTSTFVAPPLFFPGQFFPNRFDNSLVVVRAGLNYKFNWIFWPLPHSDASQ